MTAINILFFQQKMFCFRFIVNHICSWKVIVSVIVTEGTGLLSVDTLVIVESVLLTRYRCRRVALISMKASVEAVVVPCPKRIMELFARLLALTANRILPYCTSRLASFRFEAPIGYFYTLK
jgi:hypothetical protein